MKSSLQLQTSFPINICTKYLYCHIFLFHLSNWYLISYFFTSSYVQVFVFIISWHWCQIQLLFVYYPFDVLYYPQILSCTFRSEFRRNSDFFGISGKYFRNTVPIGNKICLSVNLKFRKWTAKFRSRSLCTRPCTIYLVMVPGVAETFIDIS